jgi:hypothetical protein
VAKVRLPYRFGITIILVEPTALVWSTVSGGISLHMGFLPTFDSLFMLPATPHCYLSATMESKAKKSRCQQKQTKAINHHSQQQTNQGARPGQTQAIFQELKNNPSR